MKHSNHFKTISDLFEEQAALCPTNIAIYLEDRQISYEAFNKQTNQYARFLQKKGVLLNSLVGIQLTRSLEMLVAIYAVAKVGAAYLPIDPFSPSIRNQIILQDGQIKFLIVNDLSLLTSIELYKNDLILLNIHENVSQEDCRNLNVPRQKQDLAYVMYTSGTTGKPKGVMISHEALLNRMLWMSNTFPFKDHEVLFQKTYPCFDISVWETWW